MPGSVTAGIPFSESAANDAERPRRGRRTRKSARRRRNSSRVLASSARRRGGETKFRNCARILPTRVACSPASVRRPRSGPAPSSSPSPRSRPARCAHTPAVEAYDSGRICARRTHLGRPGSEPGRTCASRTRRRLEAHPLVPVGARPSRICASRVGLARVAPGLRRSVCATRRFGQSRTRPPPECLRRAQVRPESCPTSAGVFAPRAGSALAGARLDSRRRIAWPWSEPHELRTRPRSSASSSPAANSRARLRGASNRSPSVEVTRDGSTVPGRLDGV
ncbi:MAG: hypothetical protein QOE59_588 [Actinomycetota bacterium]|nr:hypothetical protein [Actinomycetota bacterium]